jgi:hypothetical protein
MASCDCDYSKMSILDLSCTQWHQNHKINEYAVPSSIRLVYITSPREGFERKQAYNFISIILMKKPSPRAFRFSYNFQSLSASQEKMKSREN